MRIRKVYAHILSIMLFFSTQETLSAAKRAKADKHKHSSSSSDQSKKSCKKADCFITGEGIFDFTGTPGDFQNPFVPLSANEISAIATDIKAHSEFPENALFVSCTLQEPPKEYALSHIPGDPVKRIAQTLLYVNTTNKTYEVLTDLGSMQITRFKKIHVIPPMGVVNYAGDSFPGNSLTVLLAQDPDVTKALAKRGLTPAAWFDGTISPFAWPFDSAMVQACKESGCCEQLVDPKDGDKRISYCGINMNGVDPILDSLALIDGLIILLDSTNLKVYKVIDLFVTPLPTLVPDTIIPTQHPGTLNPICWSQPDGPSYTLDGNELTWSNWKMKISWHPRTGIQLYNVTFNDNDVDRSILYKMSVSESGNYYNVENPTSYSNFNSFDSALYPFMNRLTPLVKGLDVPSYATLHDVSLINTDGSPRVIPGAYGIFEQVNELLYRGQDGPPPFAPQPGPEYGAAKQQLVIRSTFAGIIYLWTYTWIFNLDGSIESDIQVSGRTLYTVAHESNPMAQLVTKNLLCGNHTHYFNYRFDFDIDGVNNTVVESNQYTLNNAKKNKNGHKKCNSDGNICGQGVTVKETELKRELEAMRNLNVKTNRQWHVINPNSTNRLGHHHAYSLLPKSINGSSLANDWSGVTFHNSFLKHHLHVTRYHDNEQFAAGEFPIMACEDVGLGKYVKDNEKIENKDIVVWYSMLYSHEPSSEDYPFVSTKTFGIKLVPDNFFETNPACTLSTRICDGCDQ